MTREKLADSPLSEAIYLDGASDYTLVTFAPMRFFANNKRLWAQKFVTKNKIRTLGIVPKAPHWYPTRDTRALIERATKAVPLRPPVITYGFSMGGYGALKYSAMLEAAAAIAASPQISIHPDDVPEDDRYRRYFRPVRHRSMIISQGDLSRRCYVIYGSAVAQDRVNAQAIRDRGGDQVHLFDLWYLSHSSLLPLLGSEAGLKALSAALDPNPATFGRVFRELGSRRKKSTISYFLALANRAAASGRVELAVAILDEAGELHPHPRCYLVKAKHLRALGRSEEAMDALATARDLARERGRRTSLPLLRLARAR